MGEKNQELNANVSDETMYSPGPFLNSLWSDSLERKTLNYVKELGETGAGIERGEDIDMEKPNSFTTKWSKCLWGARAVY